MGIDRVNVKQDYYSMVEQEIIINKNLFKDKVIVFKGHYLKLKFINLVSDIVKDTFYIIYDGVKIFFYFDDLQTATKERNKLTSILGWGDALKDNNV